jgi:hypothetical protein
MTPLLPDYGDRSLGAVLPALLDALLGSPAGLIEPARAAVLLLIDGLGDALLRTHAADAPFLAALPNAGPVSVGFPSSTAVSLASLGTGRPPTEHGIVGTSFRVADGVALNALRWTGPDDLRDAHPPEVVQPLPTLLERATVVSSRAFAGSGLTRAVLRSETFRGVHALGDLAAEILHAAAEPGLVYGYHADLDLMGHVYGPGSLPWRLQLSQVDRLVETITSRLPAGTALVVTGDHGMVTMERTFDADTDPALREGVIMLGGEPRARHVYAAPGAAADVLSAWRATLGDAAWTVPREQAMDEGWFGPASSRFASRIGDVVVAARDDVGVIRSAAEPFLSRLPGQHGSLTADELLVPLLVSQ